MSSENSSYYEYHRTTAFLLASDIGMQVVDDSNKIPLSPILNNDIRSMPAGVSVGFVNTAQHLHTQFVNTIGTNLKLEQMTKYGYTPKDDLGNRMFYKGSADQNFTWHFSPAIACAAVDALVNHGEITETQKQSMSLKDYANLIGSGWFSDLIHDFALTKNGLYGRFGIETRDFAANGLKNHLAGEIDRDIRNNLFITQTKRETDEIGITIDYKTVSLSQPFRMALRKRMTESRIDRGRGAGCPVARHAGALSLDLIQNNTHASSLTEKGIIKFSEPAGNKVRFTQPVSPIDMSLSILANRLDQYALLFGEPYIEQVDSNRRKSKTHVQKAPANILWEEVTIS